MADISDTAARETSVAKSTILRFIRPVSSSPEMAALRAEVEGLRLALSIAQDALREERADKDHWREEAKHLRQFLAGGKPPEIINAAPHVEAPALAPALEPESKDQATSEMAATDSADAGRRWWGRLFA